MLWLSLTLETATAVPFHPQECGFKGGMWHGMIETALHTHAPALRTALCGGQAHQRARYALFPPLDAAPEYPPGHRIQCALVLYGAACALWPDVLQALARPGALRLGRHRAALRLTLAEALHPQQAPTPLHPCDGRPADPPAITAIPSHPRGAAHLGLRLLTPVTIGSEAQRALGLESEPVALARWVKALRLRLCELEPALAQGFAFGAAAWQEQEHALRAVRIAAAEVELRHWTYGSRTKPRPLALCGQVGQMRFEGGIGPDVLALLDLGQWLAVGQRTTMGQGWYRLL